MLRRLQDSASAENTPTSPRDASAAPSPPAEHGSERNLLFGILALQMDFVSRNQLVAAMHAWVLEKRTPGVTPAEHRGAESGSSTH